MGQVCKVAPWCDVLRFDFEGGQSMVEALDAKVLKLMRVQIGALRIGTLQIGRWRYLTQDEVEAIQSSRKSQVVRRQSGRWASE